MVLISLPKNSFYAKFHLGRCNVMTQNQLVWQKIWSFWPMDCHNHSRTSKQNCLIALEEQTCNGLIPLISKMWVRMVLTLFNFTFLLFLWSHFCTILGDSSLLTSDKFLPRDKVYPTLLLKYPRKFIFSTFIDSHEILYCHFGTDFLHVLCILSI